MVQEGPAAASADRVYVHGGRVDEIVASQVSGVWYNHHYDAQGNCILLSTASGGLQEQYDYDAFGYPYFYTASGGKGGNVKTRFLFTGREWISDMRIYDYRARMYQPELGRFLQPDPKEFAAGDYDLYRYCHNDPVNKSDPTGLREELAGEIHRDIMWDMARYADSSNTSQGSFADFTGGAYMGGGGGGGNGGGGNRDMAGHPNTGGAQNSNVNASPSQTSQQGDQGLEYDNLTEPDRSPYDIKWHLKNPSKNGGCIVQHVQGYWKKGGRDEYWEGWEVMPNRQSTTDYEWDKLDDRFSGGPGTQIHGEARFYEGLSLPSSFKRASVEHAGGLRATKDNPHLSTVGATDPVNRYWQNQ